MDSVDRQDPVHNQGEIKRILALTCLPAVLALLSRLAILLPEGFVLTQVTMATVLAAPPFLMALWPVWSIFVAWRTGHRAIPAFGAFLGIALSGVPPAWLSTQADGLDIVVANVNAYPDTPQVEELEQALGAFEADILVIIEQRPMQIPGMVRAADNFDDDLPRISHATAIFCRDGLDQSRCQAHVTPEFGSESFEMPLGLVRVDEKICIMGIHGPPPAPYNPTGLRPYVEQVASAISEGKLNRDWGPCRKGDHPLVSGDLNAPPGHPVHRILLKRGLEDKVKWFGIWAATWPSGGGWPNLPYYQLDQVLSGNVPVHNIDFHRLPGSDHKAISMTVPVP